ncbi:MAG: hypothetical protein KJ899_08330 [Gammaproteobacteria bacterium]|nr:hypothetical protein [Gammaproteobacteria bacterium]MBU1967613.1 hypothetical protein [Gammaproteobacteria bacterium]
MSVSGVVAASNGIFDASPRNDGSGNLWMSFSTVDFSANEPTLTEVRTRIASSADGGTTWTDAGVDPNNNSAPDLLVPNPLGAGNVWADWHYEVSSLLYDPIDPDTTRRWKMLWHRMLYVSVGGDSVMSVDNSWIGLSTASTPDGVWSSERKLFAGSLYNAAVNVVISAPEKQLNALHAPLSNCLAFTEPSMLAKADDIYISLHCLGGASNSKIFGMRCDRSFSTCTYLGDFLQGSEAAQFSQSGQSFSGFSATELVSVGGNDYLVVTPTETSGDTYRGCLAFRISDLATATLARTNGVPTLIKRISGTSGSFNGACGYDADATGSGIIYSEANASAPNFRMFASHISLP